MEAEDLDRLKRQPEWVEVQIFMRAKLAMTQERMCAIGIDPVELGHLAVRGAIYRELLDWALKEPEGGAK